MDDKTSTRVPKQGVVAAVLSIKRKINTHRVAQEKAALHVREEADTCCPGLGWAS